MKTNDDLTVYDIAALIRSCLQGDITPEGRQMLEAWLEESPENKRLLEKLADADWRNMEVEKILRYVPADKWQLIVSKAHRKKSRRLMRRYSSVAAIAVLCIGLSLFINRKQASQLQESLTVSHSAMAKLTTGDGRTVLLDSTVSQLDRHISVRNHNEIVFSQKDSSDLQDDSSVKYNTLEIIRGGEYCIVLADGTTVFLNSETTLKFPDDFSSANNRKVYLTGEALFKVAKDENKPFIVECKNYSVKVLGTVFNVSDYPDDPFSHTTLKEGKVEINRANEQVILTPGNQACLQDGKLTVQKVDVENYTTWMDENFRFKSENIDRILKRLARWYDFEVFYLNPEVKNYHFSGFLPRYGKVSDVLDLLSNTTDIRFEVKGKTVIVHTK